MSDGFTHEELLAYFEETAPSRAAEETPNSITSSELAAVAGCSPHTARRRLQELAAAGILRPERVIRANEWGERNSVRGYVMCAER